MVDAANGESRADSETGRPRAHDRAIDHRLASHDHQWR